MSSTNTGKRVIICAFVAILCFFCRLYIDFRSKDKFDSKCGWPSFSKSATPEAIVRHSDLSFGMNRVETKCSQVIHRLT